MNDYIEARIDVAQCDEIKTDVLAALLGEVGFESFVPDAEGLTAYAPVAAFTAQALEEAVGRSGYQTRCSHKLVPGQDWNAEWERNYFQPIVIDGQCVVHSSFHTGIPPCPLDIVIDPKMAFGTGHHATTWLMVHNILQLDLRGKSVLDMGTGTAILAIVAAMRGAGKVVGVEIDEFAAVNARENVALNGHPEITVVNADASALEGIRGVDLFLANINRNVILADLPAYAATLNPGAAMLLSGFYEKDAPMLLEAARGLGLDLEARTVRDGWCCLKLRYRP